MMKKIFIAFLCLLCMPFCVGNLQAQDPDFYVYLCLGQSNMEGFWNQTHLEPEDMEGVDPRFRMLAAVDDPARHRTKGNWYTAVPPLCRPDCFLTPADYFGRTMVKCLPENKKVGVAMVAVGGISIKGFMKDESISGPYNEAFFEVFDGIYNAYNRNLYGTLVELGKKAQQDGVIKGILMLQGEADTGDPAWTANVKRVYEDLLADLGLNAKDVPLLAGETLYNGTLFTNTNAQNIDKLPKVIPTAHVISAEGCETSSDYIHFTAKGYRLIGRRFASEALKVLGQEDESIRQMREPFLSYLQSVKDVYLQPYREHVGGAHIRLGEKLDKAELQMETATKKLQLLSARKELLDAVLTYISEAEPDVAGMFDLTFLLNTPDVSFSKIGQKLSNAWFTDNAQPGTFHYVINDKVPWITSSETAGGFTAAYGLVSPSPATSGFQIYQKTGPLPAGTYKATASAFGWGTEVNGAWKGTYPPRFTFSAGDTDGADVITENYNEVSVVFALGQSSDNVKIGIKAHEGNDCPWAAMANTRLYKLPSEWESKEQVLQGWTKLNTIPENPDKWLFVLTDKEHPLMMGLAEDVNPYNNVMTKSMHYQYMTSPYCDHSKVWMLTRTQGWDWNDGTVCYSLRNLGYPSLFLQTEWASPWCLRTHDQSAPVSWTALIPQYVAEGDYWTFLNGMYPKANACAGIGLNDINSEDWGYLGPWNDGRKGDGTIVAANKKGDNIGHFELWGILKSEFDKGQPTSVRRIEAQAADPFRNTDTVYDMQGRLVRSATVHAGNPQLKRGLYVMNGRKVFIR